MKIFISFLLLAFGLAASPQNKLDHALSEFGVSIGLDTSEWRRVTYDEMKAFTQKNKTDIDHYLNRQSFLAYFLFVPRDSTIHPRCTLVSIYIDSINTLDFMLGRQADSSFNSSVSTGFLDRFAGGSYHPGSPGGRTYFDSHTQSVIFKFTTVTLPFSGGWVPPEYVRPPDNFLIMQTAKNENFLVRVEYQCFVHQSPDYFPKFEKIIRSYR
jgi:hypothetical protein